MKCNFCHNEATHNSFILDIDACDQCWNREGEDINALLREKLGIDSNS